MTQPRSNDGRFLAAAKCPHGHVVAEVGRDDKGRCLACQRSAHERTPLRRLIERRSKRKVANARDLERLERILWQSD